MWWPPGLFAQPLEFTSSQLKELEAVNREERDRRDMVVPAWQGWGEQVAGQPPPGVQSVCVGASAMPGTSPVVLTTEPGAGPCPSSWPLSPGPARTKGTALSHTELRGEHGPYGQRFPRATESLC